METQLKKGLLDVCVLAAILNEDSYGYRIIETIKPYISVSESTLYPILRRLGEAGLLEVRPVEYNGRTRKYYHITQAGIDRINLFLNEWNEVMTIYRFVSREADNK
ncbi:MAG: PadR family transcriptional regulator [Clostridia bacterium]|nr:PadR family transcriptional regulator [Clostridia bacterium]